jgi:hypothetical protein
MSQTTSQNSFQRATEIPNPLISMVGAPGFEPGTSCAQGKRATRLRHAPMTGKGYISHFAKLP